MSIVLEALERELREWLNARVRDCYSLDFIEPETARAILRIWCAGKEQGFPALRVEYRLWKHEPPRAVYDVPAGAAAWFEWLQSHIDSVALDALYRYLYPPCPIRRRQGGQ